MLTCSSNYNGKNENKKSLAGQGFRRLNYGDLNRVRTCDPYPVKIVLSQLSYQIMLATINNIAGRRTQVNTFLTIG